MSNEKIEPIGPGHGAPASPARIANAGSDPKESIPQIASERTSDAEATDPEADGVRRKRGATQHMWQWKPKSARYDPENPPKFTIYLNLLFAIVSWGHNGAATQRQGGFVAPQVLTEFQLTTEST